MYKLLMAFLVLMIPLTAVAEKSNCMFPVGMVKQNPPADMASVAKFQWDIGQDKKGGDTIQTLRILYKNGNHVVIQHQYCNGYRFEINYVRQTRSENLDVAAIAKIVASLYSQYYSAPQPVTFSKPLEAIITASLNPRNFDKLDDIITTSLEPRNFDIHSNVHNSLPENDAHYPDAKVKYGVDYTVLDFHRVFSSVITFYLSINSAMQAPLPGA